MTKSNHHFVCGKNINRRPRNTVTFIRDKTGEEKVQVGKTDQVGKLV